MAYITVHGGMCCGVNHIYGFTGRETREDIESLFRRVGVRHSDTSCILVEAILTNKQCNNNNGYLPELLQRVGFRLVARFKNHNSGNFCNVFHYLPTPAGPRSRVPFKIIQPETN